MALHSQKMDVRDIIKSFKNADEAWKSGQVDGEVIKERLKKYQNSLINNLNQFSSSSVTLGDLRVEKLEPEPKPRFQSDFEKTLDLIKRHNDMARTFPRQINPNIQLNWAGFRSTSFELGQAGWELQAQQDFMNNRFGLVAINHKIKAILIGQMIDFNFYGHASGQRNQPEFANMNQLKLDADMIHPDTHIRLGNWPDFNQLQRVDHIPDISNMEIKKIGDMFLFKPKDTQEILIEPSNLQGALDNILKMQSKKQKELREKQKQNIKRQVHQIENNIVTASMAEIICLKEQ